MRILLFFLAIFAITKPSLAEDQNLEVICKQLNVHHTPDSDVNYQPNADIDGNAVVPADIGNTISSTTFFPIRIPLEIDMLEQLGLDNSASNFIADTQIAEILIYEDGKVTYNGQNISQKTKSLCLKNENSEKLPSSIITDGLPTSGEVLEGDHH